ncbi:hypothetical protein LCGC14_1287100 [marine sediment metagenome]|uniref:Uncharacterized protein n=1 Tax=marine sediment metagenome TaxID=412755 RepID=A0A0F9KTI8_9ZZZZ
MKAVNRTTKARLKLKIKFRRRSKKRKNKILNAIKEKEGHSAYSLSKILDIPLRTLQRTIANLIDEHKIKIVCADEQTGKRAKNTLTLTKGIPCFKCKKDITKTRYYDGNDWCDDCYKEDWKKREEAGLI